MPKCQPVGRRRDRINRTAVRAHPSEVLLQTREKTWRWDSAAGMMPTGVAVSPHARIGRNISSTAEAKTLDNPDTVAVDRFRRWLEAMNIRLVCPACHGQDFGLKGMVAALVIDGERTAVPPEVATYLPVQCDKCNYTMFFSAIPPGFAQSLDDPAG